jgi:hypothetical protein
MSSSSSSRKEELWKGPPPPPDAQQVAKDLSCQGIIGFALKDTLDEILAEQELEIAEQEQVIVDEPNNMNSTATTTTAEEDETAESNQNNDNASEIAQTLPSPIRVDQRMVTNILQAFGKSVAQSQQERYSQELQQQQKQQGTSTAATNASVEPPAALLKGRLEHYNRRNTKWRIVLKDVDFQRRRPLDKNRRKRERISLWQVGREQQQQQQSGNSNSNGNGNTGESASTTTMPLPTQTTNNSTTSNYTLEILAYNDLE